MNTFVIPFQDETCQTDLQQLGVGKTQSNVVVIAVVLSIVVIMLVAILGWVLYAYRNPTSRSGQLLIRST